MRGIMLPAQARQTRSKQLRRVIGQLGWCQSRQSRPGPVLIGTLSMLSGSGGAVNTDFMPQLDQGIGEFAYVHRCPLIAQHRNALIRTDVSDFHVPLLQQTYMIARVTSRCWSYRVRNPSSMACTAMICP